MCSGIECDHVRLLFRTQLLWQHETTLVVGIGNSRYSPCATHFTDFYPFKARAVYEIRSSTVKRAAVFSCDLDFERDTRFRGFKRLV